MRMPRTNLCCCRPQKMSRVFFVKVRSAFTKNANFLFRTILLLLLAWAVQSAALQAAASPQPAAPAGGFTFALAADIRYFTGAGSYDLPQYFRGAVQQLKDLGGAAFLISPGDIDPPDGARWTVDQVLGPAFRWVPVVGNHELPDNGMELASGANLAYLRAYDQGAVNPGPADCPTTTFSFDYQNAHFAVLNEYCAAGGDDVTLGDISDEVYSWLAADLAGSTQRHKFVIGHAPAYPLPDEDNGRLRHELDSLNQYPVHRDRFWSLLKTMGVAAYFCGHTHNFSAAQMDGVWQVDAGHARGLGDPGAPSTLVMVQVSSTAVVARTYRDDSNGGPYTLRHTDLLVPAARIFLPQLNK